MHVRHLLVIAALAVAFVGCKKKPKDNKGTDPQIKTIPKEVGVKLISAGSGAKHTLRYKFKAGVSYKASMDMKMVISMTVGGREVPSQTLPVTRTHMVVDNKSVSAAGDLSYDFKITSSEILPSSDPVDPRVLAALKPALKQFEGMSGTAVVSARGMTKKATLNMPPTLPPMVRQLMDSLQQQMSKLSTPLPIEPVGVGASWKVEMPLKTPILTIGQTATNTLTGINGDQITLKAKITQFALPQQMKPPGLPAGAKVMLTSLNSTGSGSVTIDLTNPIPSATVEIRSRFKQTISMSGRNTDMSMDLEVGMTVKTE